LEALKGDCIESSEGKKRSLGGYLLLWGKGFCMGTADVIPGVSGGTMAFIMGIYDELLCAIRSFDLKGIALLARGDFGAFLRRIEWGFLTALGAGILTAIFTLARVLSWLLVYYPIHVWAFFFGLIAASVISVSRKVTVWHLGAWTAFMAGGAAGYIIVGLTPAQMPHYPWFLFLSGGLAICAMILPGISGAFVLVLLGQYAYVLNAVNQRDLKVLILVAGGACIGLALFSRCLGWLLRNYRNATLAALTGLMIGSLRKIWPWKSEGLNTLPADFTGETILSLALAAAGVIIVLAVERAAAKDH
jgi:putative membrane protein